MPRVKRGTKRRNSRKKTLALAKGFFLTKSKLYRSAQEAVEKVAQIRIRRPQAEEARFPLPVDCPHRSRRAGREMSYSQFMDGLKKAGIDLNRKMLADMALTDAAGVCRAGGAGQGGACKAAPPPQKAA